MCHLFSGSRLQPNPACSVHSMVNPQHGQPFSRSKSSQVNPYSEARPALHLLHSCLAVTQATYTHNLLHRLAQSHPTLKQKAGVYSQQTPLTTPVNYHCTTCPQVLHILAHNLNTAISAGEAGRAEQCRGKLPHHAQPCHVTEWDLQ